MEELENGTNCQKIVYAEILDVFKKISHYHVPPTKCCIVLEKDKAFFKETFKLNYDKFKKEDMLKFIESLIIS